MPLHIQLPYTKQWNNQQDKVLGNRRSTIRVCQNTDIHTFAFNVAVPERSYRGTRKYCEKKNSQGINDYIHEDDISNDTESARLRVEYLQVEHYQGYFDEA